MTMMKCGHAANATHEGQPACVICAGLTPNALIMDNSPPDLTERKAMCGCGKIEPSNSTFIAFFEYRGEGSNAALDCKVCGYSPTAHKAEKIHYPTLQKCVDENTYEPRGGMEYDSFYCGHAGWD